MHHCVASYSRACYEKHSSIWSLTCQDQRELTIQLTLNPYPKIVQVRGLKNREATPRENAIIHLWADRRGIKYDRV